MKNTYTDGTRTTTASSYKEAAKNLYGCTYYQNPSVTLQKATIPTTYVYTHRGHAEVIVYKPGDKQGEYWGVHAAIPTRHTLRRA